MEEESVPQIIQCPGCQQRYQAQPGLGPQVQCPSCGTTIAVGPASSPSATTPRAPATQTQFAPLGMTHSARGRQPLATPSPSRPLAAASSAKSPGGPSDSQIRLAAGGMLGLGVLLSVGSYGLAAATGSVYLFVVGLIPLLVLLGLAGVAVPDIVRSIGQYGRHLPWYYKASGWGLVGVSLMSTIGIMVGLFSAGFRSDTPRPKRRNRPLTSAPSRPSTRPASPFSKRPNGSARPSSSRPAPSPPATNGQSAARPNRPPGGNPSGAAVSSALPRKSYPVTIDVPSHSVRVPDDIKLTPGTHIEACWADKWNPLTVLSENSDGSVNVRWDDFSERFNCSMLRAELIIRAEFIDRNAGVTLVKEPAGEAPPSFSASELAAKPLKKYPVTIALPAGWSRVPADATLSGGARLQACWASKWNPITFLGHNKDGTLTVRWDDFGPAFDCRMQRDELVVETGQLAAPR